MAGFRQESLIDTLQLYKNQKEYPNKSSLLIYLKVHRQTHIKAADPTFLPIAKSTPQILEKCRPLKILHRL